MRWHIRLGVVCALAVAAALWADPGLAQQASPPPQEPDYDDRFELRCGRCDNLSEGYPRGPYAIEYISAPGTAGCNPRVTAPGAAGNCPRVSGRSGRGGGSTSGDRGSDRSRRADSDAPDSRGPTARPPPPPSHDEALATCPPPPEPVLGRDPDPEGVTGMDTYLWAQPQDAMSSTTSVRGYPVACTITPMTWTWRTGDGGSYTRNRPGGPHPDNPADHVYETKGDYQMSLTVAWRATTTYGSAALTRTTTQPYTVFEIRSVLTR